MLATRLNAGPNKLPGVEIRNEFETIFRFLVREIADSAKGEMAKLRVDQFSSFVLQVHVYIIMSFNLLLCTVFFFPF